jgi:hypothetical protein
VARSRRLAEARPLWRRTWRHIHGRETLWNRDRVTSHGVFVGADSLFVWMIRSHFRHRREWPRKLSGRSVVRLQTPHEVDLWLQTFERTQEERSRPP